MTRTASRSTTARSLSERRSHCSCAARAAATRESVRSALVAMRKCYADPIEIRELRGEPGSEVVAADRRADLLEASSPLARLHRQRFVDRLRLAVDVERIDGHGPLAEILVGAGVLRQDQHAVAAVDERRLLRDEVEAVEDRVDEQRVVLLVRRDRLDEVV